MPSDLTAVLVPSSQLDEARVREIVAASGRAAALVRVAPLEALQLIQIEVHDARRGVPSEDPDLVARFSRGGRATFVHVNHEAKQALVHTFADGTAGEQFIGEPGEALDARLSADTGAALAAIAAADDGTRRGIGIAASRTQALVHGRALVVPAGTPTMLDSFHFHDQGAAVAEGADRLCWFAFDRRRAFARAGRELAAEIAAAPKGAFGPLEGARAEATAALAALEAARPDEAKLADTRALELAALSSALVFAGGDEAAYWDERVLPLFAILGGDKPPAPVFDGADAEELDDETETLLEAMVETLPFPAPPGGEGSLLAQLAASEVSALAPWLPAGEHAGAMFALDPTRLLATVRRLDGQRLGEACELFARAWYRALRPGQPEGDAYASFRRAKEEEGRHDFHRFTRDWAELRACLEVATANALDVALLFYA